MNDFWTYIGSWSVLKWVLLVLAAGFIGHFGRMAAEAMVAKARAGREQTNAASQEVSPPYRSPNSTPDKKIFKALAKVRKKEAKKK
jgi:hypothetical protein